MRQQHHVVALAAADQSTSPGEIATLANTKHAAQAMDGEFRFCPIDEREPHRLPSRAKKAVAFFRMSRSWRRISFSRRSRFSSAVTSLSAAAGSTACRSRLRPIQRTSVDSPIPRSPAISRCVRPLVCTKRTASSANSFVNRRCCIVEFLLNHRGTLHFSEASPDSLSVELLDELKETTAPAISTLGEDQRAEVDDTMDMLSGNLEKIAEHGKRADNIVKSMLEHSRGVTGERREVDLNGLVEEALNLAYHGARAQDQSFKIPLERDYASTLKPIELAPQEITRVFLNLFGNGFYAATKRARENGDVSFRPILTVATRNVGDTVEVRVRDNGIGIPTEIKDNLFQPFLTTSPLARAQAWACRSATTS